MYKPSLPPSPPPFLAPLLLSSLCLSFPPFLLPSFLAFFQFFPPWKIHFKFPGVDSSSCLIARAQFKSSLFITFLLHFQILSSLSLDLSKPSLSVPRLRLQIAENTVFCFPPFPSNPVSYQAQFDLGNIFLKAVLFESLFWTKRFNVPYSLQNKD